MSKRSYTHEKALEHKYANEIKVNEGENLLNSTRAC